MTGKSPLAQTATELVHLPVGVSGAALVAGAVGRELSSFAPPFVPIPLDLRCAEQLESAARVVEEMDKLIHEILADPSDGAIELLLRKHVVRLTDVLQAAVGSLDGQGYWWSLWQRSDVSRILTLKQRYLRGTLKALTATQRTHKSKKTPLAEYAHFVKKDKVRNAWMTNSGLLRSRLRSHALRLRERIRTSVQGYVMRDRAEQFALVSPESAAKFRLGLPVTSAIIDEILALARDGANLAGADAHEIEVMAKELVATFAERKGAEILDGVKRFRRNVAAMIHPDRHSPSNSAKSTELQAKANVLMGQLEALAEETLPYVGSAPRNS